MYLKKICLIILNIVFCCSLLAATQSQNMTDESAELLEQLEEQIKGTLMAIAENESKVGRDMSTFYYSIEVPAQKITNLGLVLDVIHSASGYKVLSVTPGSAADRLKIKSGDQVLSINSIRIDDASSNSAISELHNLIPGDKLELTIKSEGQFREISTIVTGQLIPRIQMEFGSEEEYVDESCGVVSIFLTPPQDKAIATVKIYQVDDDRLKTNRHSFRITPGWHTIYVYRNYDASSVTGRKIDPEKIKSIEMNIDKNTTYYFGAQFKNTFKRQSADDWEPVVWKSVTRDCSL
jgi:hypothetical protein